MDHFSSFLPPVGQTTLVFKSALPRLSPSLKMFRPSCLLFTSQLQNLVPPFFPYSYRSLFPPFLPPVLQPPTSLPTRGVAPGRCDSKMHFLTFSRRYTAIFRLFFESPPLSCWGAPRGCGACSCRVVCVLHARRF